MFWAWNSRAAVWQFSYKAEDMQKSDLNQAKHISSAVTVSGLTHHSLSSKPSPALTAQLKIIWELSWDRCGGTISRWALLSLQMQFRVAAASMKCIKPTPTKISFQVEQMWPGLSAQSKVSFEVRWNYLEFYPFSYWKTSKDKRPVQVPCAAPMSVQACPGTGWQIISFVQTLLASTNY